MEPTVVILPLLAVTAGLLVGWLLARFMAAPLAWALMALLLLAALGVVIRAQGVSGFEGIGMVASALLLLAPAGLGTGLGALAETLRLRRRLHRCGNHVDKG